MAAKKAPIPLRGAGTKPPGSPFQIAGAFAAERGAPTVTSTPAVENQTPPPIVPVAAHSLAKISDEVRTAPQEILVPGDEPVTVGDYADKIGMLYSRAEESYVEIGRLLAKAKERLPYGERSQLVDRLPFSSRTAYMLIQAANAIDAGLIDRSKAPRSWANVYLLASFSDDEREKAEEAGIVRPDVKRAEILAFRRRLKPKEAEERDEFADLDPESARAELEKLQAEEAKLRERIERLRAFVTEK